MTRELNAVNIEGIEVINTTKKDFLHYHLYPRLNRKQQSFVVFADTATLMHANKDITYKQIIQSADYVVPNGEGIISAAKYKKQPFIERIEAYDMILDLLKFAEVQGLSCYFLGGKDYINEKTVLEVEQKFPNVRIAGHYHGSISIEDSHIAEEMKQANPDLIFVSLKKGKQEQWIATYKNQFQKGMFIGVSDSFELLADERKQTPQKWKRVNLEWLYRLLQKPSRIGQTISKIGFVLHLILKNK